MCVVAAWHDVGRESSFHISEHDGGRVIVDTIENDNTKRRRDGLVVVVVVVVVMVVLFFVHTLRKEFSVHHHTSQREIVFSWND